MGLRFDPIGGGQFKQAIKAIIDAESVPLKQLEARKTQEENRLKLFQDFKGKFANIDKALTEMSSFKKLREFKVDLGDGVNIATATLDKEKAQPGTYQIQVDQLAARTSVISNGFTSPDDKSLGIGYVTMDAESGEGIEIFVDEKHASLRGVADAINGEARAPVRAAVIKDASDEDAPWKLILSSKKDGAVNQITIPEFYFMDGESDFYIDDKKEAQNARVTMDGFPIELESNDINDFLPGVNLHLKQAKPDQPFTLTISEDQQKVAGKVKNLVDQVNGVLDFIVKQNQIDEKSDTRTTFAGDSGLQNVEYRMRNLMHEGFPVGNPEGENFRLVFMNELGVEFDKTGHLTFNEQKFQKVSEKDFDGIAEAISGDSGFSFQMKSVIDGYTRAGDGMLATREQGFRRRIKDIDGQIDTKTRQIDRKQQSLVEQFSRLEASLSNMQRQQQALSATLPSGGGNNLVSQLLGG